jgi:NAD(P)-dependent dehydrogenase (short-subunit alcohol dehydrogenase family)
MKEKGYSKIINQSSGGAWLGSSHYGLTKLGMVSMTISLAKELAPHGIGSTRSLPAGSTRRPA